MRTRGFSFTFFLFFSFFCVAPAFSQSYEEKEVVAAAEEFVALIDSGLFAESWDEGDHLLQIRTTRDEWIHLLTINREIFGWSIERHTRLTAFRDSLSGLPDGDYVVVVFDSAFDNKKSAIETLVMAFDEGQWRPAAYSLK